MSVSAYMNQGNKQKKYENFHLFYKLLNLLAIYFAKMRSSTDGAHQQITLGTSITFTALLSTTLKLGELGVRRHTAKNCFSSP